MTFKGNQMYDKLDGLFLDNRKCGTLAIGLGQKNNSSSGATSLRNATNNPVSLKGSEIWPTTLGQLHRFDPNENLPARSAIRLTKLTCTKDTAFDALILVNRYTQEYISKVGFDALPSNFPGVMPIGGWQQKKRMPADTSIPCFTAGTIIATREGEKRIEDLRLGYHVVTRDSGFVQIQAISQQSYLPAEQRLNIDFRPIVIPAGTFSNPSDLHLSPVHRLMVTDSQAELLFGSSEVLVAAKTALSYAWVHQKPANFDVTYYHILFPIHELMMVEEMWAESLFVGDMLERVLETGKIWETLDGFDMSKVVHKDTIRPVLRGNEARSLMHRLPDCIDKVAAKQAPNEVFCAAA